MKKIISISLVVVFLMMVLVSSIALAEETTISILRPGDPSKVKDFLEPAIEEFEANNPNIKIEPMYLGWASWIQKYQSMFEANKQPDIIMWWDFQLSSEFVKDKLVPLQDYLSSKLLSRYPTEILNQGRLNGELYQVPANVCSFMLFYRKDVFKEAGLDPNKPPKTWDELMQYAKTIKENTNTTPMGMNVKAGQTELHETVSLFYYQGTGNNWLDKNNKPLFNTPEAVKALKFWKELKPYTQGGETQYGRADIRPLIRDGKVAMSTGDSAWIVPMLQKKFGKDLDKSPIGFAKPPKGPAGEYNWIGADGWVITNKDKAEAAGKFVSFLASPEHQYRHDSIYGGVPIYESELSKSAFQYDFWKTFREAVFDMSQKQRIGKYHPNPQALYPPLERLWQKLWLGVETSEDALDIAEEKVNAINEQYNIK